MWQKFLQVFSYSDLRKRILYTILLLVLVRVLAHIPLPGVNETELKSFFSNNQIFGLLDMFSGGAMRNFSLALMGVGPYITASIIMQLLGMVVPSLEALQKEGESGQHKINQWSRYLTVPLAIIQSYAMIMLLKNQGVITFFSPQMLTTMLISAMAGTVLLMWLGELISENGIGNGISLIITLGIIAGIPTALRNTLAIVAAGGIIDWSKMVWLIVMVAVALIVIAIIVLMTEGERQIPVTYARRVRGVSSNYGALSTHLPLRVNSAGVIPIIFAMSLMLFPGTAAQFLGQAKTVWLANSAKWLGDLFANNLFYGIFYFVLVVAFTYFYTFVVFKPDQIAENIQKQGGFIPGVRPGNETSRFLYQVLSKITLAGAIFLGFIAVLPFILQAATHINTMAIGGTGLLIVVSVIIETRRQLQAQMMMRKYENY